MSSKISLYHYTTGHLGLRIETKLVLSCISLTVLLGFTQVPIASATSSTPNILEILSYGGDITFIGGGSQTKMHVVGAEEFMTFPSNDGLIYTPSDQTVFSNNDQGLIAEVYLPDGATVTQIDCAIKKISSDSNFQCDLFNSQYGTTTSTVMATANTIGLPGLPAMQFISSSSISDPVIDNDNKNYWIDVNTESLFTLTFPDCGFLECRLNSVKITYTVPSSGMTVGGIFYPVDNVSLILAYGIMNSYWMLPTALGIGVGIYLVKRKIE